MHYGAQKILNVTFHHNETSKIMGKPVQGLGILHVKKVVKTFRQLPMWHLLSILEDKYI